MIIRNTNNIRLGVMSQRALTLFTSNGFPRDYFNNKDKSVVLSWSKYDRLGIKKIDEGIYEIFTR